MNLDGTERERTRLIWGAVYKFDPEDTITWTQQHKEGNQRPIIYGFELMQTAESLSIPFTIMQTRFPSARSVVVYDNACNLENYCLKDRIHWNNHTGCSFGYKINLFEAYSQLNTSASEQTNSVLVRIKNSLLP